jgi:thymidylate synthase
MEFKDVNEAVKYYGKLLLDSSPIISENDKNKDGYKNELRGELIQQFFTIKNPTKVISTYQNHKSYKWWMYCEILSEFLNLDPPLMYKYKPEMFSQHYDLLEDGRMQYTYSNRFVEFNQFVNVYKKLKNNPTSKRAVVSIYTPYDTSPDRKDSPCTTMYQFINRNNKLHMIVIMRSWDFFGGFKTYDFALSSFIQQSFCSWLNLELGNLSFYVNSLHYYNRDREMLEYLVNESSINFLQSDELKLDEKINIETFYKEIRKVKEFEEAIFNGNIIKAIKLKESLKINLFKDMCETLQKKNER